MAGTGPALITRPFPYTLTPGTSVSTSVVGRIPPMYSTRTTRSSGSYERTVTGPGWAQAPTTPTSPAITAAFTTFVMPCLTRRPGGGFHASTVDQVDRLSTDCRPPGSSSDRDTTVDGDREVAMSAFDVWNAAGRPLTPAQP